MKGRIKERNRKERRQDMTGDEKTAKKEKTMKENREGKAGSKNKENK